MDDKAFDAILSQPIPPEGLMVDFDHYSSLTEDERAKLKEMNIQLPSKAAGWIRKMAKRVTDGLARIWAEVDLTPEGARAIEEKEYVWTSPVHPRAALENLGDGKVRPMAISKVALTNEPNIKAIGTVLDNRGSLDLENAASWADGLHGEAQQIEDAAIDERDSIEKEPRKRKTRMKEQIAKLLKLDPAADDDVIVEAVRALVEKEASAQAEVQNRANELAAKTTEAAELKNRAETAETELGTMKTAQAKAEADAKVAAELAKYPDLPNRSQAEEILRADFDKGSAFLASLKITTKVPGQNPDLANREENKTELRGIARVAAAVKK
jgi:phage I-like protein